MIAEGLVNSDYYTNATQQHTLTIAGVSDVPVEIFGDVKIDIADDLLTIDGLSVQILYIASLHGIGKTTVVKISKKGLFSLSNNIGDVNADRKSVEAQATTFMFATYGKITEPCGHNRDRWLCG